MTTRSNHKLDALPKDDPFWKNISLANDLSRLVASSEAKGKIKDCFLDIQGSMDYDDFQGQVVAIYVQRIDRHWTASICLRDGTIWTSEASSKNKSKHRKNTKQRVFSKKV